MRTRQVQFANWTGHAAWWHGKDWDVELLLFFVALIAISLLAVLFGTDSQDDVVASREHALALMGMTWDGSPRPRSYGQQPRFIARDVLPVTTERRVTRARPRAAVARHAMATALYRAADWLAPDVSKVRAA